MKNSTNIQNKSLMEQSTLTDYHWQKRADALQEAQEMLKHPLSLQQMKHQTQQNKMSLKEQNKKTA